MNSSNVKNYKSRIRLYQCLAIVIRKEGCRGDPGDFWMYENGYLLFQGLLSSNSLCWWNSGLNGATKSLSYLGYISPGALLVGSEPCAIDIVKTAWERRVLQPPSGYQIVGLEEIDDCYGVPVSQTQWTPLPEAVCSVVLRLSRQGRPAGIETIREALILTFPHVSPPSEQALYDTLVQLTTEKKLYHTSNGYFIVTPERRRSRSHSRSRGGACNRRPCDETDTVTGKTMLMTTDEALVMVHGDMTTIRDGNVTHQLIQTNLADVICGGNLSDKILYPRNCKQRNLTTTTSSSSSSTTSSFSRSPDRRGSFRLWRSNRSRLRRSASTRTISKHYTADTTSSSTETSTPQTNSPPPRKESLLSRLFRKSRRSQINTFSAQFPPTEWFNSKAVHLHSIGTQTTIDKQQSTVPIAHYLENGEIKPSRSATLPRRHYQRHLSTDLTIKSRDSSPTKLNYASLPRSNKLSMNNRDNSKRTTNRNSLIKQETSNQCDVAHIKTSQNKTDLIDNNSGPSSIESQKSSTKTDSSINSGPSSLESHKTVINTKMNDVDLTTTTKKSNSFTLQVTTNQSKLNNKKTTAMINGDSSNGTSTKIYVENSPIRSVITFENGQSGDGRNPNLVIINDTENQQQQQQQQQQQEQEPQVKVATKLTNQTKETNLNNSYDDIKTMNNSRKLSLQLPNQNKDNLSFHNLIKNISSGHNRYSSTSNPDSPVAQQPGFITKIYNSSPPSPTKSVDSIANSTTTTIDTPSNDVKQNEKNLLGSEPNLIYNTTTTTTPINKKDTEFPSLNDLTAFNFTSLAAQKILKGVGLNSVDTLVELNMTANLDKQNNCDVVHTDFGMF